MPPRKRIKYTVPKLKVVTYRRGQRPKTDLVPILLQPERQGAAIEIAAAESLASTDNAVDPVLSSEQHNTTYYDRKHKELDQWAAVRDKLVTVHLLKDFPSVNICSECSEQCDQILRCTDCGPCMYLCETCEAQRHATLQVLHRVEMWEVHIDYFYVSKFQFQC
jgi:hypothetical protein